MLFIRYLRKRFRNSLSDGLLFHTSIIIVSKHFHRKEVACHRDYIDGAIVSVCVSTFSTPHDLLMTGSLLEAMIHPIIFSRLGPQIGFRWTTRAITLVVVVILVVSVLAVKPQRRSLVKLTRKFHVVSIFNTSFLFFCLTIYLNFMGIYAFFSYIVLYAQQQIHVVVNITTQIMTIVNAGSLVGRPIPSYPGL